MAAGATAGAVTIVSHIQKRGPKRWTARYKDPDGRERAKSFPRKSDAERFLRDVDHAIGTGTYLDPSRGKLTVGEWARQWLQTLGHLKPSTRERYKSTLRAHVLPRWSKVRLQAVSHGSIQAWCSSLAEQSPSVARKSHRVLSLLLALAVRDGRLAKNPADGILLPREVPRERRFLTHSEVQRLAEAAGDHAVAILFLAYTGVRFGELAALRVSRIDLAKRRAEICGSVTAVNGTLVWGTPKGHATRSVSFPTFLAKALKPLLESKKPDDLVFTSANGFPLRASNFRRDVFAPAARVAGIKGISPHSLRHTAASLAIAAGANVKVLQSMLGHRSATLTLDLYGHLMADQLDDVADALDRAATEATSGGRTADGQMTLL